MKKLSARSLVKYLCFIALVACGREGTSTLFDDVIPSEKLGKIIVQRPDLNGHAEYDASSYRSVSLNNGGQLRVLNLNQEYKVPAGELCLSTDHVVGNQTIRIIHCGFMIKKGETTTVVLAGLIPSLNEGALVTDLGPKAVLRVTSPVAETSLYSAEVLLEKKRLLLVPPGKYDLSYLVEGHQEATNPLAGVTFPVVLTNAQIKILPVTPAEKRAFVSVKFNNDRKLPKTTDLSRFSSLSSFPAMLGISRDVAGTQVFKIFPKAANEYALNSNSGEVKLKPEAGKSYSYTLEILNVYHFDRVTPGNFKLNVKVGEAWTYIMQYRTETSIDVLRAGSYKLDFYITDSIGNTTLEDEVLLNY